MSYLRSGSGRPLASPDWLLTHHRAKLGERTAFVKMLTALHPLRVIDLGCGTGLWLDLMDRFLPPSCEFIGIDSDPEALAIAEAAALGWNRVARFECLDVETEASSISSADLTLLFNVMPYLANPASLLARLRNRDVPGALAIRQYDGAAIRFGPMDTEVRALIDSSLRAATSSSDQFRHYDMDRVFDLACTWGSEHRIEFECFERTTPFEPQFAKYVGETILWMIGLVSDEAAEHLRTWRDLAMEGGAPSYWFEVEMSTVLS